MENLTLANLGGGGAAELFEDALARIIANVLDPNTDHKPPREIVLHVRLIPREDRKRTAVRYWVTSKLAPARVFETDAALGEIDGKLVARELGMPAELFEQDGSPSADVLRIPDAGERG